MDKKDEIRLAYETEIRKAKIVSMTIISTLFGLMALAGTAWGKLGLQSLFVIIFSVGAFVLIHMISD